MIIVIASAKGGSGKTTTAIHLAEYLSLKHSSKQVVLLDGDPDNRSAAKWYARGAVWKFELIEPDEEVPDDFDILIVDSGAAPASDELEELLEGADLLIIPTAPSVMDLESAVEVASDFDDDGSVQLLITLAQPGISREGTDAVEALEEQGFSTCPHVVRRRAALKEAPGQGTTVAAMKGAPAKKAWNEYQVAFNWLLRGMN